MYVMLLGLSELIVCVRIGPHDGTSPGYCAGLLPYPSVNVCVTVVAFEQSVAELYENDSRQVT